MSNALNTLNEGFLYNGLTHKNLLKFYGCYMTESTFHNDFFEEGLEKDQDEEEHASLSKD